MKLTRKQWMMLVVLVLGAFVTVLNQTLVTPALPSIMTEMNVDQSTAQWLTTGFTLVNAIMIPITAFLQDRFSTRKLFVFSMSLFAVGTLLAAVGLNFPVLLGGRLVQAAGAGILMPVTMTVLMLVFPVDRRGSAMGIFGLVIAFAPAIGPTVAGFVIDQAAPYCDEITVDTMGSVVAWKRCKKEGAPTVMIAAHMDEVGFMVQYVRDDGLIRYMKIGRASCRERV